MRASRFAATAGILSLCGATSTNEFECPDAPSLDCDTIVANGMEFSCRFTGGREARAAPINAVLLHGFPEFSRWWIPLMEHWQRELGADMRAVACDLRGYSAGASPDDEDSYAYDLLAQDVWAIADAVGFGSDTRFHLLGHDHGSMLGYRVATQPGAEDRLLSYTGISVPHPTAFSWALGGGNEAQAVASGYFNQFSAPNSANALWPVFGGPDGTFPTAQALQRTLWWYSGALPYVTRPAVYDDATFYKYIPRWSFMDFVRLSLPISERPAQEPSSELGPVRVPTLFLCGSDDEFLLCTQEWAKDPSYYADRFDYEAFPCGHDLMRAGPNACDADDTVRAIFASIDRHLQTNISQPVVVSAQ